MTSPIVKICGVRAVEQARIAADAGADMIGLVFAESKRRVTVDEARAITSATYERRPRFVGVFVNENPETIRRIAGAMGLDLVQYSGAETRSDVERVDLPHTKVVHVRAGMSAADVLRIATLYPHAEAIVLDATGKTSLTRWGGSGSAVDWGLAASVMKASGLPIMLAGGLRPDNVAAAIHTVRPWGVDVSSGVETDGVKDAEKIRVFVGTAKAALEGVPS